jgi:hypothetical protein
MHRGADKFFHLTYCTNIHPANGWNEVYANIQRYVPILKNRLSPTGDFGLGLRLSGRESLEVLQHNRLQHFRNFLHDQGLYVFTLNGFPYGPFHHQAVKTCVHSPDWREEERVAYTLRLVDILSALLPEGMEGSISTSPLSYKAWVNPRDTHTWRVFTRNIVRIAEALVKVKREQNRLIYLALEPEPDGLLENSDEITRFYKDWLLQEGAYMLAHALSVSTEQARMDLLEHIRVCLDTCHVAVAYEEPGVVLNRYERVGIKIGKVQVSSALKIIFPERAELLTGLVTRSAFARSLQPFMDSTYLHQVVQQNRDGSLRHYPDLDEALTLIQDRQIAQWRIHFHVPIFIDRYADSTTTFLSTQDAIVETLDLLQKRRFCQHVEIETYTWSVLPAEMRKDLLDSITREYEWVMMRLA